MSETSSSVATSLRVVPVRDECGLAGLRQSWDALAAEIPFRSFDWAQTWWRHYRDARSQLLTLLVMDDDDGLVGVAPWFITCLKGRGRVIRFLGSGEVCSDYVTLLTQPEMTESVAHRLAAWLAHEAHGQWDLLDLRGVEENDGAIDCLGKRLAARGHLVDRRADLNCWRTSLPNTWEEFLSALSASRRARTRSVLRRSIESGRVTLHQVRTEAELDRAFAVLVELHQKRRKSLSQAGCFSSPRFTAFHHEMTRRLLAGGRLRLLWTEIDGRPLTAEYGFVDEETIYYYLGGFDPELADEGPGWLGLSASLKLAVEEGYRAFDFLRGDESYKASWRAAPRPLAQVRIVGNHPSARLRFAAWRACEQAKGRARHVLSRIRK